MLNSIRPFVFWIMAFSVIVLVNASVGLAMRTPAKSFYTGLCESWVSDVTIPNGGPPLAAGKLARKVWKLKNCGAIEWHNVRLVLIWFEGDSAGRATVENSSAATTSVPNAKPGTSVNVRVRFRAPSHAGFYDLIYELAFAGHVPKTRDVSRVYRFGQPIDAKFQVK